MFQIVSSFPAHEGPVKVLSVQPGGTGIIVSGGQDSAVRQWVFDGNTLCETSSPLHHSHWITALTHLPPNCHPQFPDGLIVSACMDNAIRLFDYTGALKGSLVGHLKSTISFSWTEDYNLVSGSWDGTARVWDLATGACIACFEGHENGVHVLALPQGLVATVSTGEQVEGRPANFKLRVWSTATGSQVQPAVEDHSGPIRSIFNIPGFGFGTTSNDGTLRLRLSPDGQCVSVCCHPPSEGGGGYPPFVLAGAALSFPDGTMGSVTCAEDGSVVVWKGAEMYQAIPHPCCVWDVCTVAREDGQLPDIVTAGHDGFLRVFSCSEYLISSAAAQQLQQNFLHEVQAQAAARHAGPSSEELAQYPLWADRGNVQGSSEGQVKVFRRDSVAVAAQWDSHAGCWVEIGEVTGTAGASDGGELNGVRYDHIIPVEIETSHGVVELKLGYNNAESHFTSAQRFIDENMLGQHYLRQIADFVAARKGQAAPTLDMSGSGQRDAVVAAPPQQSFVCFPSRVFVTYDEVPPNTSKVVSKIAELQSSQQADLGSSTASGECWLSNSDLTSLGDLLAVLVDKSHYHSSTISAHMLSPLVKMATLWNDSTALFPCFDLLRMVAYHPDGARTLASLSSCRTVLARAIGVLEPNSSAGGTAHCLTSMRFLTNTFRHEVLRKEVVQCLFASSDDAAGNLSHALIPQVNSSKKSHRHAAALLLHNVLIWLVQKTTTTTTMMSTTTTSVELFAAATLLLTNESESIDIVLKCLLSIGTVLLAIRDGLVPGLSCLADSCADTLRTVSAVRDAWGRQQLEESNVLHCLEEVETILHSIIHRTHH